jgi:hypothetical protein
MASQATEIGVRLMVQARAIDRVPRSVLLGAATVAGGVFVALTHVAGVDVQGLSAGQSTLGTDLIRIAFPDTR